jgi:hypothetical protein
MVFFFQLLIDLLPRTNVSPPQWVPDHALALGPPSLAAILMVSGTGYAAVSQGLAMQATTGSLVARQGGWGPR